MTCCIFPKAIFKIFIENVVFYFTVYSSVSVQFAIVTAGIECTHATEYMTEYITVINLKLYEKVLNKKRKKVIKYYKSIIKNKISEQKPNLLVSGTYLYKRRYK